ncbi:MAG: adenylate/guanylate cyclase domain-containing protein [Pseudomonadota bacterium]
MDLFKPRQPCYTLNGLYAIGAASTAVGVVAIALLNISTPLEYFMLRRVEITGGWETMLPLLLRRGSVLLGVILANTVIITWNMSRMLRPLARCLGHLKRGERVPPELMERGRRQLINLPYTFVPANMVGWCIASLVVYGIVHYFHELDQHAAVAMAVRSLMMGLISSAVAFFWLEDHARRRLVMLLFPRGHLSAVPGARAISITQRIKALNWAGSLMPLFILLVTMFTLQYEVEKRDISAVDYGREILLFGLILAGFFIATLATLNRLVGRSITEPLDQMLKVVKKVEQGDYGQRIQVVSNDEIGVLGDAGNELIQGLAEKEMLHNIFGKYVTPEIRDEILSGRISFLGDRREATVMFADLRGFTPYVEEHSPEVVIADMRSYFTAMHRAIRSEGGVVLQFAGDQIEAAFGVPVGYDHHADAALRASLAMRRALRELNQERLAAGRVTLAHGVGIHSGRVLAGNTGSEDQSAYALIGDTVNLASRIQDLTKVAGCDILVSQAAVDQLSGEYPLGPAEPYAVKGASRPVLVRPVL